MPVAGSEHHAIYWRRRPPEGTAKRPAILQAARSRIEQALLERRGPLWLAFAELAPVFRCTDGAAHVSDRRRRLRKDAAVNMASLLNVMLSCTDLASGLVASPSAPGVLWQSKSWADLAGFAYGDLVADEVSIRRAERHARSLQAMGLIKSVQWFVHDQSGRVRSPAAKKFITDKLWKLLGLARQIKQLRRAREQERNKERIERVAGLAQQKAKRRPDSQPQGADEAPQRFNAEAYKQHPPSPPRERSAGADEAARLAIEEIKRRLG